jgi:ABC-2 type transport system permease protein
MHNLGNVFRFEVTRTLKKKSFWIIAFALPLALGAVFGIVYFSSQLSNKATENTVNQKFSFVVTDKSGLVSSQLVSKLGASTTDDKQVAINKVINGSLDAYFYYPSNLVTHKVEIYAKDAGLFSDNRYQGVANEILQDSVAPTVSRQATAVLQNTVGFNSNLYKNGAKYDEIKELIAPGVFLVLFYVLIAVFGNQMLASTTEEKENRVIEIILTTIKARTLIIGKILSLLVLAFIQIFVILTPIVIVYILFRNQLSLPNFDLSNIPLDPVRIAIGAIVFFFGFLMFTGLLVAIGAAVPTAKEASGFFGVVVILLFGPLYAVALFVSNPESGLVRFLSFFPLTAPIPLLIRNAVGNLSTSDVLIGISIIVISSIIALTIAIRAFQYGALEYSNRISLKKFLRGR